jgi:hypothetical protein
VAGERTTGRPPEGEAVPVKPLVVAVLGVMWVVVLAPPLLRSWLRERRSASAIGARRRIAPPRRPDTRLRQVGADPARRARGDVALGPAQRPGTPETPRHQRSERYPHDAEDYRRTPDQDERTGDGPALRYRSGSVRATVRRRRDVLFALVVTAGVTAVGGFGLGSGVLIVVNLVADGFLVLYVLLLVRVRRAGERRAMRELWSRAA